MAARGEGDVALWLHNKLGSTDDLWSGGSICSQLTREKLVAVQDCFHQLQSHVKVKFMLSFLHLHKRNVDEWQAELEEILSAGREDPDQWVAMVADMLQPFPSTGGINMAIHTQHAIFQHIQQELKKIVKKNPETNMMPLECSSLSRSAMVSVSGHQPSALKHFALKRKPKSAALRAEILQKSNEAANNLKKNVGPSIPVKIRNFAKNMDDSSPMRAIPTGRLGSSSGSTPGFLRSHPPSGSRFGGTSALGSRPGGLRREGGVKLLDISEQPVGAKEAKRRKKAAEQEQAELQKKEKDLAANTPDYAAGLVSSSITGINDAETTGSNYSSTTANRVQTTIIPATVLAPSAQQKARNNLQVQLQQQLGQSQTQPTWPAQTSGSVTTLQIATNTPASPVQKMPPQQLALTKELIMEAHAILKKSDKLTSREKQLILGFMGGCRDNPCPQQGNIVNILLSESQESIQQHDGLFKPMIVDTYFQMNYETGEWKQIKKCRNLEPE